MIELPKQLKNKKFRFIKIAEGAKKPIEGDWAVESNYRYNEKDFVKYLKTAKSYGVVCNFDNLVIVDIENSDDKSLINIAYTVLPKTFTVKTGNGGVHLYYRVKDLNKRVLLVKDGRHYGEIQSKGNQCLGPGSLHPSGNTYDIEINNDIKTIDKDELLKYLDGYIEEQKFVINTAGGMNWDISKLLKYCPKLGSTDGKKYRGPHPVHGSSKGEKGSNFEIDIEENTWYCFRCHIGGDAVSLIAMLEGLVKIEDTCPSKETVRKEFLAIKKVGIEKYGYEDNYRPNIFKHEGKKKKLNTEEIAKYLQGQISFIAIEDATGRATHIYAYQDGYYKLNGESILRTMVKKLFIEQKVLWSTYHENEIVNYIKTDKTINRNTIRINPNLINLNNGIYNIETKKLEKHSPRHYFLYKIPWDYKPQAKLTDKILNYFNSTFNKNKYIKFTQELFGYCLYARYNYHGLFYLYGTGGNGKTVWLKLLEHLLGEENITNKSIGSLMSNRFVTAQLYGKLLNSCGELSGYVLDHTDMLKRLTAGERIEAEFKGKDGFDFPNYAKIITACNSIPESLDKTDGWYDRQYILPFLKKFRYTKQQDLNLIQKLITKEGMEGLLVWALDGLHRLLSEKKFTYQINKKDVYLMYQENTKYFIKAQYEHTNLNEYILVDDIRKDYETWCKDNDIPADSNESLSRSFRYYSYPSPQMMSINNKKVYVRCGIKKVL